MPNIVYGPRSASRRRYVHESCDTGKPRCNVRPHEPFIGVWYVPTGQAVTCPQCLALQGEDAQR